MHRYDVKQYSSIRTLLEEYLRPYRYHGMVRYVPVCHACRGCIHDGACTQRWPVVARAAALHCCVPHFVKSRTSQLKHAVPGAMVPVCGHCRFFVSSVTTEGGPAVVASAGCVDTTTR